MVPSPPTPFARALTCYRLVDVKKAIRRVTHATFKQLQSWPLVYVYIEVLDDHAKEVILKDLEDSKLARLRVYQPAKRPHPHQTPAPAPSVLATGSINVHREDDTGHQMDVDEQGVVGEQADSEDVPVIPDNYLQCVGQETLHRCVTEFTDRTGNSAFKHGTCASCQRSLFMEELTLQPVTSIPNRHLLKPASPHPAMVLSAEGLLLAGGPHEGSAEVPICSDCSSRLAKAKRPRLALANNLWIGDIPPELQGLTLPERVLISLYFPSAYIVKLYSKNTRPVNWNDAKTQRGIKGNVSTYKLDQQLIADMIGLTMPPPIRILSATIAITYVGPNNLNKACLPGTFRVRRPRVDKALRWLKANNPLYQKINISQERLQQLPQNDVPDEVFDTTRHSDDVDRLDEEHATYVPLHDGVDNETFLAQMVPDDAMDVDPAHTDVAPNVIPLQSLAVLDVAGNDIPNDELFTHALANTVGRSTSKAEYAVRHSGAFVNEYARRDPATGLRFDGGADNPNHLLGTFPFLFPYGRGGFETNQPDIVSYESHARWAMHYSDRRFRLDPLFLFHVFGVIQKREVCRSSVLQISCASDAIQAQLRQLTEKDLLLAAQEEAQKKPFSNPAIRCLRSQMTAIRARVTGTDESRHSIRSKIWGTNLLFNSPSLWITINPPDCHDPIAQVLMGEDINLDNFCATAGPSSEERACNVAADPFAAAQYFHRIIKLILESLFGIKAEGNGQRIRRTEGLFGTVQAYIGTVEAQGRGTLHLHLLMWLEGTPGPKEYANLLKAENFVEKMRAFIRQNISADVNNLTTDQLKTMRVLKECAYSRPLDPRSSDYSKALPNRLKELARACQFHNCDGRCYVVRKGVKVCKRGAPWPMAPDAWVSEAGHWGPKRISGVLNNFNPTLLTTLRTNHDIKVITQGSATRNLIWYITNYASKKQQKSSNTSALLAKKFAFHTKEENRNPNAADRNKRLLQRCANSLTRDREFSAPEVVSYLMGWGDRFESHFYVNIRWDLAFRHLLRSYPMLKEQSNRLWKSSGTDSGPTSESATTDDSASSETYTLQFVGDTLDLRNQLKEYAHRGRELDDYSFLKTFLDTYDAPYTEAETITVVDPSVAQTQRHTRPRHDRILYLESYGNTKRCRVRRARLHETLPRFVGRWFPRADDPKVRELYCASMLMLLKPWRSVEDLKSASQSFEQSYNDFCQDATPWTTRVIDNIQHYYDCADQANAEAREDRNSMSYPVPLSEDLRQDLGVVIPNLIDPTEGLTEGDVEAARRLQFQEREREYLDLSLHIAEEAGLNVPQNRLSAMENWARRAEGDEIETIGVWEQQLKAITRASAPLTRPTQDSNTDPAVLDATAIPTSTYQVDASVTPIAEEVAAPAPTHLSNDILNDEQQRAHDIIVQAMMNEVNGVPQRQLLMVVHGQGGTGKTTLIRAVTRTLEQNKAAQFLGKTATSGIAASPIGGATVHSYFGLPVSIRGDDWINNANDKVKDRRIHNLGEKHMVFIDEMSMLTKANLANISRIAQVVRGQSSEGRGNSTLPFGGLHIVLFGDFHQFPPVASDKNALYLDLQASTDVRAAIGREIFLQFDAVVFLEKQNRCWDQRWTDLLDRARVGECTEDDIDEVNKLALNDNRCIIPDFSSAEWQDVILVTTRHCLRMEWNNRALLKYCKEAGLHRYIIQAEDIDSSTDEEPRLDFRVAAAALNWKHTGKLADRIEIAKGMKVMVCINIATEADVANGTRGVIEDFWLHPGEDSQVLEDGSILLSHLPPVIFFRPDEPSAVSFEGVPPGLIPICPLHATFTVANSIDQQCRIKRRQYAITGAYSFTDYKSQGQTIEKVIIDLSKPPTGKGPTPFSAYVALSRGRGRDHIRLLRTIDPALLTTHPSEGLRDEMQRLAVLNEKTKVSWNAEHDKSGILVDNMNL